MDWWRLDKICLLLSFISLAVGGQFKWPDCSATVLKPTMFKDHVVYNATNAGCSISHLILNCPDHGRLKLLKIAIVDCNEHNSNYSAIPSELSTSTWKDLEFDRLVMANVEMAGPIAPVARALGSANTQLSIVELRNVRGEIRPEHVNGLDTVKTVTVTNADLTAFPFDALDTLPQLEEFYMMRCFNLKLEAGGGGITPHPSLRTLVIKYSGVTDVPQTAFARLGNILYLHLNELEQLNREALQGLEHLETLDLSESPISLLDRGLFSLAPRLRTIILDETNLEGIAAQAFEGLQHLEEISIEKGRRPIEFEPRALAALPALKKLTLHSTPLVEPLPLDLLEGSTAVNDINMRDTRLKAIPQIFQNQSIKKLDISQNIIKNLYSDDFQQCDNLEYLNMDENEVEELPNYLMINCRNLICFSANHNKLRHIGYHTFPSFLEYLHLSGNELSHMMPDAPNLNSLKRLDLVGNNFTELQDAHLIFNSPNLEVDLRNNNITHIKQSLHTIQLKHQATINLENNPLTCDCRLYPYLANQNVSIKLVVGDAKCASPPTFEGIFIRKLILISLTCSIQDCPDHCTCSVSPTLTSIVLDCKNEPSLYPNPENYGQKTTHLRLRSEPNQKLPCHVLNLNLSGIGLVNPPSLDILTCVVNLDLSDNNLVELPKDLLKTNMVLHLAKNPFDCSCEHWNIKKIQPYLGRIIDADALVCGSKPLLYLKHAIGDCADQRRLNSSTVIIVILVIFVCVIAFIAVLYRHRLSNCVR